MRIPRSVAEDDCGYLEDRRPSSNCDPYQVTNAIVQTTIRAELVINVFRVIQIRIFSIQLTGLVFVVDALSSNDKDASTTNLSSQKQTTSTHV